MLNRRELEPPPPPAALPPPAKLPPLFAALLSGDVDRANQLLEGGSGPNDTATSGLTALHAAVLGSAAGAVPVLLAAGVPVDAQLSAPLLLPKEEGQFSSKTVPAGCTALTLACMLGQAATVQALLAAGATCELPTLSSSMYGDLVAEGAASPWHWAVERSMSSRYHGSEDAVAATKAVRASLLEDALQRVAAGTLAPGPEQLMALLVASSLKPSFSDQLTAVAALPGAAEGLSAEQRHRLAELVVDRGDVAAVEALQAGPLCQQLLDPDGEMLRSFARQRDAKVLPMARALLQHGTRITLDTINSVINQRMNAPLLELLLGSGLPLPAVPRGSKQRSIAMWDGEYGSTEEFFDVTCPFYSLFRRDSHYLMKTPQELRVRMCQALLRAGYRPTVYKSIELQVLNKRGDCYDPRVLHNFHILKDWGRKGLSKDGRERICCFPGAYPQQDRLLTGDNRWLQEGVQIGGVAQCWMRRSFQSLLWMLIEGEPWSPADHRYWPPAFKAAARTLLLAHRRGAPVSRRAGASRASGSALAVELQATPLSHLPLGFVLAVIAEAAFPLEAWFDEESKESWLAAEFWREINWGF